MGTTERVSDDEQLDAPLEGETSQQNLHAQDEEKAEGGQPPEAEDVTAHGRPETD
ncbi:hypothetical protein [Streptacidiphilus monticola]|jgi:hypothetical protein|uniref:Uncharacterized protein n=1 Tax=Streptacidiphilus monticola TaxID=2161674 RepID=A0ABW1FZ29_9ACTN